MTEDKIEIDKNELINWMATLSYSADSLTEAIVGAETIPNYSNEVILKNLQKVHNNLTKLKIKMQENLEESLKVSLKDCPMCGGRPFWVYPSEWTPPGKHACVECLKCGLSTAKYESREDSWVAWNIRKKPRNLERSSHE